MAVIDAEISKETSDRYLAYALSVVSGRALPDVRDGLKPVQRRILFAMLSNLNLRPNGSHRKSAAVVGEVLAKFHPHGDIPCYEAMVRMTQEFSLRYPLVDGQGNFGSIDGDNAAAYRYTEAKLHELALDIIGDITEETVPFRANFDGTTDEPCVLPSRVPNMLINGATGIAVGMATSIPPHHLGDTIKALVELLDDPEISTSKLATTIKAPDFPTGCQILNSQKEISDMYRTGRGSIRMRGEWEIEEGQRGKRSIIITSVPFAINKAQLVEKIADLIIQRKVPQLVDIRDESTADVRVVIELASDADPEVAMAYIYKNTTLESHFSVNMTALVPVGEHQSRPELLSLKQCLQHFLDFREVVVERKLRYEKKKLEERIHILEGLAIIYDALDEVIKIVRKSEGRTDAAQKLRTRFKLTEIQSFAVVDMRIYQLSKTNIDEILAELKLKLSRKKEIELILASRNKMLAIVRKDLLDIAEKYKDKRKCKLVKDSVEVEFREEDYVVQEDVYAIITQDGWVKRIRQNNELASTRVREGDTILRALALNTVDQVALFTNLGNLYVLKVTDFPSSSGYGDPVQKLLKFKDGEKIIEAFGLTSGQANEQQQKQQELFFKPEKLSFVFVTKKGLGLRTSVEGFDSVKRNGKRVVKVRDGDALRVVCSPAKRIAFFSRMGYGLSIDQKEIQEREGASIGIQLFSVRPEDEMVTAIPYSKDVAIDIELASGGTKQVKLSEVVEGKRALKGNKVIARGEIKGVKLAGEK
jgi:DNA gyrase subunit A